jgi:hypothetical protein
MVRPQVTLQIPSPRPERHASTEENSRRPERQSNLFPVAKPKKDEKGVATGQEQLPRLDADGV